ncbi:Hypothetical predicted protein, partial [Xyrichtys novacula]
DHFIDFNQVSDPMAAFWPLGMAFWCNTVTQAVDETVATAISTRSPTHNCKQQQASYAGSDGQIL